jgi:prophage DNA circulation protein
LQGKYSLVESFTEGGVARFTVTFVNAGRAALPISTTDIGQLYVAADKITFAWKSSLKTGLLGGVLSAVEAVNGALAAMDQVYSTLTSIQSKVVGAISAVQTYVAQVRGTVESIISFPDQFIDAIANTLSVYNNMLGGTTNSTDPSLVNACLNTAGYQGLTDTIPTGTPQRDDQVVMRAWMTESVMAEAIAQAVRCTMLMEFKSYNDTKAMLDKLMAAIDAALDHIGSNSQNDTLTDALHSLKSPLTNVMLDKGANLPKLVDVELGGDARPALVLAQQLYGDVDRNTEITDMNPIEMRHPGFPTAGGTIRALSA